MKTPPLCKAKNHENKEVKGYYERQGDMHFINCSKTFVRHWVLDTTIQIQCSDGKFRPIGEVCIINKTQGFKEFTVEFKDMICPECQEVQCDEDCINPRETH